MADPTADPFAGVDPSSISFPMSAKLVYYSHLYVAVITPLLAISSVLVGARLFTRIKSAIGICLDDWLVVLAAVLSAVDWASVIAGNISALNGSSFVTLSSILAVTAPLSVVSAVMSALSVPLIKISVAIMLLRLLQGKFWKRLLYVIIAVQVIMAVFLTLMHTTRCVPLNAVWDLTVKDKKCWGTQAFRVSLSFGSVATILTDLILSLVPLSFILHIRRPLRERLMITFVMSLGMLASAASIAKTVIIQFYTDNAEASDAEIGGMKIALWSAIEEQIGIIAACLPCLRSFFQRVLYRLGLASTAGTTKPGYAPSYAHGHPTISVRTHIETVHHNKAVHREDSDEEVLVYLGLGNGSVEMKCMAT